MENTYEGQELIVLVKDDVPVNVIGQKQFVGYRKIEDENTIEVYEKINGIRSCTEVEIHPCNHHVVRAVERWASFF